MKAARFYCPELLNIGSEFVLPAAVHRHAIQVLRLRVDETIILFNGSGIDYQARLTYVDKRRSTVEILSASPVDRVSSLSITLMQSVSRGDKMDTSLQKAVELGVNRIIPVVTQKSHISSASSKVEKKYQHWQGIITHACEQSGRSEVPRLEAITIFDEALEKIVGYPVMIEPRAVQGFNNLTPQSSVTLLVGPESGFSETERERAANAGFNMVRLGPRILRTETAGLVAMSVMQNLWGDLN